VVEVVGASTLAWLSEVFEVMTDVLSAALAEHRLVAIVRGPDPTYLRRSLETMAAAGIRLAEVSLTTPDALSVISDAVEALGSTVLVGAGTVRTANDALSAVDAGAAFVVAPAVGPGIATARSLGVAVLPGAFTPTEVEAAWREGASAIKLFPASAGGPGYLSALRQPLPDIPLVAVGGVRLEDVDQWFAAGAVALGAGGPLLGDATVGGDQNELGGRVRRWLAAIGQQTGLR